MNRQRAFLMTKAEMIPAVENPSKYKEELDMSVVESTGEPIVLSALGITHSKTEAYPGDDDPDPGKEKCY